MINTNNLATIKKLCDNIEYTVIKTVKEARISPIYEQFAYDLYKDDMLQMYSEVENDIICIINNHTRDYSNIFVDRKSSKKQISETIDMLRCKVTEKECNEVIEQYIDSEHEDNLYIEFEDDTTDKQKEVIKKKILDNITIETASATGYSQSDWEDYTIAYYNDVTKENKNIIDILVKNISYMFTVQEYYINLVDIETRLYTSGIEEVEEVEGDSYSTTSYTGYIDKEELKELEKQGYTIINNN